MKIRSGFVSNSSSSSFVFIGLVRDLDDIKIAEFKKTNFMAKISYDYWNGDGDLVIALDSRMLRYLQKNPDMVDAIWEDIACGEDGLTINIKQPKLNIRRYDVSYGSSDIDNLDKLINATTKDR